LYFFIAAEVFVVFLNPEVSVLSIFIEILLLRKLAAKALPMV